MTNRKYYPNRWKQIQNIPAQYFEDIDFEDFMDWKMGGYEIPDNVVCLIRDRNLKTNKVTEHVYKQSPAAHKLIKKLAHKGDSELTICTHNAVAHIAPNNYIGEV